MPTADGNVSLPLQHFQFYLFSIGSVNDIVEQLADSNISRTFLLNFASYL